MSRVPALLLLAATACAAAAPARAAADPDGACAQAPSSPTLLQVRAAKTSAHQSADPCDCCKKAYCMAYGDPHFITFDGKFRYGFQNEAPFWLVKSDTVQIQGLANRKGGRIRSLAAGGPFLGGHKLVVDLVNDMTDFKVTWDGAPILTKKTDEYADLGGLVDLKRVEGGLDTEQHFKDLPDGHKGPTRTGPKEMGESSWAEYFASHPAYHLKLPKDVEVFVVNGKSMIALIKMPSGKVEGQTGWCGNNNEDPDDDERSKTRTTTDDDNLKKGSFFPAALLQGAEGAEVGGEGQEGKLCTGQALKKAKAACEGISEPNFHEGCLIDACLLGEGADDAFIGELLEVDEAQGIPELVGKGRCLDSQGEPYTAYTVKTAKAEGCKDALRSAAGVGGVRGAQRGPGGSCRLLVEPGHAGVGPYKKAAEGSGTSLVTRADGTAGYTCWKLN